MSISATPHFGFHDFHSFKDYVGFVKLCAPRDFPERGGVAESDQWTLDLAYDGLLLGLQFAASEGVSNNIVLECQSLFRAAFESYRADDIRAGFQSMEAAQRILRRVPSL